jgi:transcriptional regulator with XRE-family HTH domain
VSHERLQAALTHAGLSVEELADVVGVDAKTIERWVSGRVPHRRNRINVARALAVAPSELWPDHDPAPSEQSAPEDGEGELVATYLASDDPDVPDPRELIERASERIDLLDLTLGELIDAQRVAQLAERADAGVGVRVLVADPDSVHVLTEHAEHSLDAGRLWVDPVWGIERTLGYLQPLLAHPQVEVRLFTAARPHAILRVDDRMLVRLHLWGATPESEPVLELERRHDTGLFERFAEHLELIHARASIPAPVDPAVYPDPDQDPGRYRPQPPGPGRRVAHAFSAVAPTPQDRQAGVGTSPSSGPASSRRRRR